MEKGKITWYKYVLRAILPSSKVHTPAGQNSSNKTHGKTLRLVLWKAK